LKSQKRLRYALSVSLQQRENKMSQAIVVYETPDLLITIDSDDLEQMTQEELDEVIREAKATHKTGESDFFGEVTEGPNPQPVYRS
jgi:hypothetical protein